jgi:hypothetical protein
VLVSAAMEWEMNGRGTGNIWAPAAKAMRKQKMMDVGFMVSWLLDMWSKGHGLICASYSGILLKSFVGERWRGEIGYVVANMDRKGRCTLYNVRKVHSSVGVDRAMVPAMLGGGAPLVRSIHLILYC